MLVRAYDPVAMGECKRRIGNMIEYATDMYDAVCDADALLLVIEWKEFRIPNWEIVKDKMKQMVIIDGRNIYDGEELAMLGVYVCLLVSDFL